MKEFEEMMWNDDFASIQKYQKISVCFEISSVFRLLFVVNTYVETIRQNESRFNQEAWTCSITSLKDLLIYDDTDFPLIREATIIERNTIEHDAKSFVFT